MELLRLRARIVEEVRDWFWDADFLEMETPALVRAPSPEAVFQPISVRMGREEGYLATSPEFQLKRMLVGGFERIFRLGPAFRGGEEGRHHNPEFTLLEWYRSNAGLPELAADLEALLSRLAPLAESSSNLWPSNRVTAARLQETARALGSLPYRQATVAGLLREHLGMEATGIVTAPALREAALAAGIPDAASLPDDFTAAFSTLWIRAEERFSPGPLLVTEWPAPTASLARLKPGDPTVAERMELYAGGLELANGFAELTDAAEQRRRFQADLDARAALGLPPVPLDEAFLAALEEGMPPAAGMALGIDRLAMLLTGASHIRDVLTFVWGEV
jgi:lysyl-tRNA synthetase class 2